MIFEALMQFTVRFSVQAHELIDFTVYFYMFFDHHTKKIPPLGGYRE